MKDFFAQFRASRKNPVVVPALFGMAVAFGVVASMQGTPINLKSISANVVTGLEQAPNYPADLMLEGTGANRVIRIGKNAEKVKTVHFSLLGNPTYFTNLESNNPKVTIRMNEPGVAFVSIAVSDDLKAGDQLTELKITLSGETPLTLIDAGFSSESGEYSLSVQ